MLNWLLNKFRREPICGVCRKTMTPRSVHYGFPIEYGYKCCGRQSHNTSIIDWFKYSL